MTDTRAEGIAEFVKPLQVRPGSAVTLAKDFDPGDTADLAMARADEAMYAHKRAAR